MKRKNKEGFYVDFECPLCGEQLNVSAITCEENPNYSEFDCPMHGLVIAHRDGRTVTLLDTLKENCMCYISLLNYGDASITRVIVHENIAKALGLKHHDDELQKILHNLDEHIGLPVDRMSDPTKFGTKLYLLLSKKFVKSGVKQG